VILGLLCAVGLTLFHNAPVGLMPVEWEAGPWGLAKEYAVSHAKGNV